MSSETPDFIFLSLSNTLLLVSFYLSAMTCRGYPRVILAVACLVAVFQNVCCHLHFETNTKLCCEKLSNSSDFRCWNETQELRNRTNATSSAQCTQEMSRKACFNVTATQSCQFDPAENILERGKREIHVGGFVPFMKDDRYGHYTAMKMAINLINNRTDILGNYTLVLDSIDTHWVSGELYSSWFILPQFGQVFEPYSSVLISMPFSFAEN